MANSHEYTNPDVERIIIRLLELIHDEFGAFPALKRLQKILIEKADTLENDWPEPAAKGTTKKIADSWRLLSLQLKKITDEKSKE